MEIAYHLWLLMFYTSNRTHTEKKTDSINWHETEFLYCLDSGGIFPVIKSRAHARSTTFLPPARWRETQQPTSSFRWSLTAERAQRPPFSQHQAANRAVPWWGPQGASTTPLFQLRGEGIKKIKIDESKGGMLGMKGGSNSRVRME